MFVFFLHYCFRVKINKAQNVIGILCNMVWSGLVIIISCWNEIHVKRITINTSVYKGQTVYGNVYYNCYIVCCDLFGVYSNRPLNLSWSSFVFGSAMRQSLCCISITVKETKRVRRGGSFFVVWIDWIKSTTGINVYICIGDKRCSTQNMATLKIKNNIFGPIKQVKRITM